MPIQMHQLIHHVHRRSKHRETKLTFILQTNIKLLLKPPLNTHIADGRTKKRRPIMHLYLRSLVCMILHMTIQSLKLRLILTQSPLQSSIFNNPPHTLVILIFHSPPCCTAIGIPLSLVNFVHKSMSPVHLYSLSPSG